MADASSDADQGPGGRPPAGTPRWVKVLAVAALLLVLVIAVLHLTGNGLGGPGSHLPSTGQGAQEP